MNSITIHGRLTADPEGKVTNSGTSVTDFTIACERPFGKGERTTDFIDCQAWRSTSDFICRNFHKGSEVVAYGELHIEKYTTKEGYNRTKAVAVIRDMEFAGPKPAAPEADTIPIEEAIADGFEESLPF